MSIEILTLLSSIRIPLIPLLSPAPGKQLTNLYLSKLSLHYE